MNAAFRKPLLIIFVLAGCAILVGGLSLVDLTAAPAPPAFGSFMAELPMCSSGEVQLTEETCERTGPCKRKGMRVEWSRAAATLSAIEGENVREVTQLNASRLRMLLDDLALLEPDGSLAGEFVCSSWEESSDFCPLPRHTFGVRAVCSGQVMDRVYARSSLSRLTHAAQHPCERNETEPKLSLCLARVVARAMFASGYRDRIPQMIKRMEAIEP